MRALVVALVCAGCTLVVGDPDPRDVVAAPQPDLAGFHPCADVQTDPKNCGACGHDCTRLPGVDPTLVGCVAGVCDLRGACLAGHADCSGGYADGCETDLTLASHCGGCTVECGGDQPLCARDVSGNYFCTGTCPGSAPTQCGSSCVDPLHDAANCGGCNHVCTAPSNASGVCDNGVCGSVCNLGFHDCGGTCVDETSVNSCGNSCTPCPAPPANAEATCDPLFGCGSQCLPGFVTDAFGSCVAAMSTPDMAMPTDLAMPSGDMAIDTTICLLFTCTAPSDCTSLGFGCTSCSILGTCQ